MVNMKFIGKWLTQSAKKFKNESQRTRFNGYFSTSVDVRGLMAAAVLPQLHGSALVLLPKAMH